jgi:chemotaxis protein CheC
MENDKLTKEGIEALRKMAQDGANNASASLSKLVDREVVVNTLEVRAMEVEKISEIIGSPEEMTTTVTMEVRGQVNGNIMLVYPQQSAINVADFLSKRELGTTAQLDKLDKSALKESGNIISGAFLSAISNYLSINMIESIPDVATGMLKATIDSVLSRFVLRESSEAVAFEIDFEMGTAEALSINKIKAYFVLLLDVDSTDRVLQSLKGISGGEAMTQ